jgi:hypothetical protein
VFRNAGLGLPQGVSARGSAAESLANAIPSRLHLKPRPGDLAFFHDTYDRNHDGELGDPFSHVAIVESAETSGRATLIHFGSHGVKRIVLDTSRPTVHRIAEFVVNDFLRIRRSGDPPGTRYLAGELLAGFGTPDPREQPTAPHVATRDRPNAAARRSPTIVRRRVAPRLSPPTE